MADESLSLGANMSSLIEELQAQALDPSIPINDLLRKAKVVAEKLDIAELREWVDRELNGYGPTDQYPEYRKIHGEFQAFNPYHGWQPIIFPNPEGLGWLFEPRLINSPVGELDTASGDGDFAFTLQPNVKAHLVKSLEYPTDVRCLLNRMAILAIPEHVRNKILEWSIRLEKAGVRGEGLSFSPKEKQQAHGVSISIQGNVENLSNVVGVARGARVTTRQTTEGVDASSLAALCSQLRKHIDLLVPESRQDDLRLQIEAIESEAQLGTPNLGKLRRALATLQKMIRDGAVSAGSSLVTQGALALIGEALKHL